MPEARQAREVRLEPIVTNAAEAVLARQSYVSVIDLFLEMGWLQRVHVERWRKRQYDSLESVVGANLNKISAALRVFHQWATEKGLKPSETIYNAHGQAPKHPLRFSKFGDENIERAYRTHYISPKLSVAKQEKLKEKLEEGPGLVVFSVIKATQCGECNDPVLSGEMITMEQGKPLCLACADLDHLVYLPAGDPAITRRAKKFSRLSSVVVRFSRSRGRYERQGLLVEEEALRQAEESAIADEEDRAEARARNAKRRVEQDKALVDAMALKIAELYPRVPRQEAKAIARHAMERSSGRVGRTAAGRALEEEAVELAVRAAVRHRHTPYDEYLMRGTDRREARRMVADEIESVLSHWSSDRLV